MAFLCSMLKLIVTADVRSSLIPITLMMKALRCSETSAFTRTTRNKIPEEGMLHSRRRENLKFEISLTG
jgi:hypothetical protein